MSASPSARAMHYLRLGFCTVESADMAGCSHSSVLSTLRDLPASELAAVEAARRAMIHRERPFVTWVHGDFCERRGLYLCRRCDLFHDAERFRAEASRDEHLKRFRLDLERFACLGADRPVMRGGDAADNLVQLTLDAEREALDAVSDGGVV